MSNATQINVLTLLLLSPLIAWAVSLILWENLDPLKKFHDDYSDDMEAHPTNLVISRTSEIHSNSSHSSTIRRRSRQRNSKIATLLVIIKVRGRMLISYLCVLVLCQLAGAKTEPILLGVFGFFVYVYWLYQEDKRTLHRQQERADQELPSIVEMFSILVSAGESPASALMKISGVARGVFPAQIQKITQNLQNGGNLKSSLEDLSLQSDSLSIRRFCDSLIISIERGTSLSDVLSRQVEEIRSGQKANLLRQAGKVEIALMIPVVFVILPISILFALWPSYVALGQSII